MNVSRLCQKAPGSWESYKREVGMTEIYPYVQIKNSFQYSPLCWLPAQRWRVTAPSSLPSCAKKPTQVIQTHSPAALGLPYSVWCPDTLPMFYLHSDSVFLIGHRPLRIQGVLMISSRWGNWPSSFQCRVTLGNNSFECTGTEFSFNSGFATSYWHCHNQDISYKINISEQLLKRSKRGTNWGIPLCSCSCWKP